MEEVKVICSIKGTSHQGSKKLVSTVNKTNSNLIKEKVTREKMHHYKITAINTQEEYPE